MTDPKWLLVYKLQTVIGRVQRVKEFSSPQMISTFINSEFGLVESRLYPLAGPAMTPRLTFEEATDEAHQQSDDVAAEDPVRDAAPRNPARTRTTVLVDVDHASGRALVFIPGRSLLFYGELIGPGALARRIEGLAGPGEELVVMFDAVEEILGHHLMGRSGVIPFPVKPREL